MLISKTVGLVVLILFLGPLGYLILVLLRYYVKDKIYKSISSNIQEIKQVIQECFGNVPVKVYKNIQHGYLDRLQLCKELNSRQVENI